MRAGQCLCDLIRGIAKRVHPFCHTSETMVRGEFTTHMFLRDGAGTQLSPKRTRNRGWRDRDCSMVIQTVLWNPVDTVGPSVGPESWRKYKN